MQRNEEFGDMKIQEIYNKNNVEMIDIGDSITRFSFPRVNMLLEIRMDELVSGKPIPYLTTGLKDQVLVECFIKDESYFLIYVLNNQVYALIEDRNKSFENSPDKYSISIKNSSDCLQVRQIGLTHLEIFDKKGRVYVIENFLGVKQLNETFSYNANPKIIVEDIPDVISVIEYNRQHIIVSYNTQNCEINVFKIRIVPLIDNEDISITLKSRNVFEIKNLCTNLSVDINYQKIKKHQPKKIFKKSDSINFHKNNIIALYKVNNARMYIYNQANAVFVLVNNAIGVTGCEANFKFFATRRNFYFFGKFIHRATHSFRVYDYLYLVGISDYIAKFTRPFSKIRYLRKYGFFKVPIDKLIAKGRMHQGLLIGNKDKSLIHRFKITHEDGGALLQIKGSLTKIFKRIKNELLIIRITPEGNIIRTLIPYANEYHLINQIKIFIAYNFAKISSKSKKINLYFEKKSAKADESAFRVFEKVSKMEMHNSLNYFILDKKSDQFEYMKNKYKSQIIKKYSFKHYLYIFKANFFISSELPNHVLNDRLYLNNLRDKIMEVPFIFLQHGIMFAKPVDNPMALGFHKANNYYNIYKSVVSSELEKGEFYKMGYNDEDLILTGLATLDFAKLDINADKIAYMPTYRYWEERVIYSGNIEQTSYYKSIINIIDVFDKNDMLDELLIVPHNKFSEFICNNMPQYRHIIAESPTEALTMSKIFITDYSSAIYDAQYRGAYPIFYWEEKDYLIKKYQAIPPVNEDNAPGPIAMDLDELINLIKHAKASNYIVEDKYKEKFLKICEFNDNRNTDRIVEFLKADGIL